MAEINDVDSTIEKAVATAEAAAVVENATESDGSIPAEKVEAVKEELVTKATDLIEEGKKKLEEGEKEEAEKLRTAAEKTMEAANGMMDAVEGTEEEKMEEAAQNLAKLRNRKVTSPPKSTQDARRIPSATQAQSDAKWMQNNNADFKPFAWDNSIPAMTQRKNVLKAAGSNLQEYAKQQLDAFNLVVACQFKPHLIQERISPKMLQDITTGTVSGTGTVGEFWVPEVWETDPAVHLGMMPSTLYDIVRRVPVNTNRGDVPIVTGAEFKGVTEGSAPDDGDLVSGVVQYNIRKFGHKSRISDEVLEDSAFDVAAQFVDAAQRAKGRFISEQIVGGDGTTEPQGIITGVTETGSITNTAVNTALTITDLLNFFGQLDSNYRGAATFVTNSVQMARIADLSTARGQQGIENNPFGNLFGMSVALWDGTGFETAAIGASQNLAILGDFMRGYFLFERAGMTIERIREGTLREEGKTSFVATMRLDGKPVINEAFQILKTPA